MNANRDLAIMLREAGAGQPDRGRPQPDKPDGRGPDQDQHGWGQPALRLFGRADQAGRSHRAGLAHQTDGNQKARQSADQNRDGRTVQPDWQVGQAFGPDERTEVTLPPGFKPTPSLLLRPSPPVPAPAPERQPQRQHPKNARLMPNPTPPASRQSHPLTTCHNRHRRRRPPQTPSPLRTEPNPAPLQPPDHACPPTAPGTDPPPAIPP